MSEHPARDSNGQATPASSSLVLRVIVTLVCSWLTRDSVTPSTSPIPGATKDKPYDAPLRGCDDGVVPCRVDDPRLEAERVVNPLRRSVGAEARLGSRDRHEQAWVKADRERLVDEHGAPPRQGAALAGQVGVELAGEVRVDDRNRP